MIPPAWWMRDRCRHRASSAGYRYAKRTRFSEIHVISRFGELRVGADAVLWLVSQLPGYHWLATLNRSHAVRKIARLTYREIAKRRARQDCQEGQCHF